MTSLLRKYASVIIFGGLVITAALVWRVALARSATLQVSFLNVGQGDAIFLQFPDGNQVLIDGGPGAAVLSELAEVMPPWDRSIDLVVLTHPDADHLAGLLDVLTRYEIAMVVESGVRKDTMFSHAWEEAIRREGAQVVLVDGVKRFRIGEGAALDVLWPQESHAGEILDDPNIYGVVSRLAYGETAFLFSADIDRWTEGKLLEREISLHADILKVAHHGSKTSTGETFLDAVAPKVAVIFVGEENRYGHPSSWVLDRLKRRSIEILRTDRDGRVTIRSDGHTLAVDSDG